MGDVEAEVPQTTGEEGEEQVEVQEGGGEGVGGGEGEAAGGEGPSPRRRGSRRKGRAPPGLVPYLQRNAGFSVKYPVDMTPYRPPPKEPKSVDRLVQTRKAWEQDGRMQAQNYKAMEKRRQRQREDTLPAIASVRSLTSVSVDSSHSVLAMQAAAKKKDKDAQKSRYGEKVLGDDGINRVRFSFYVKNDEIVERTLLTTQSRKVERLDQHISRIERNLNFIKESRLREYALIQLIHGREVDQLTMQELQQHPIDKDLQYTKSLMSKEVAKFERKRNHLEWVARRRLAHGDDKANTSDLNLPKLKVKGSPRGRSSRRHARDGGEEDALADLVAGGAGAGAQEEAANEETQGGATAEEAQEEAAEEAKEEDVPPAVE